MRVLLELLEKTVESLKNAPKSIFPLVGFFSGYMVTATRKLTTTKAFKEKIMVK